MNLGLDAKFREFVAALDVFVAKNAAIVLIAIAINEPGGNPAFDGLRGSTDTPGDLSYEHKKIAFHPSYPYPP